MPLIGQVANKVPQNPKCNSCLHYDMTKSLCEIGLAPSSCGNGSMPDTGYSPLSQVRPDVETAEYPSHAEPARVGGVPAPQERIPIITSHLGDESELLAMAKSLSRDIEKHCQVGCAIHQRGATGQANIQAYGTTCSCAPFTKSLLAHNIHKSLPPRTRAKVSEDDMLIWVESKIDQLVSNHTTIR